MTLLPNCGISVIFASIGKVQSPLSVGSHPPECVMLSGFWPFPVVKRRMKPKKSRQNIIPRTARDEIFRVQKRMSAWGRRSQQQSLMFSSRNMHTNHACSLSNKPARSNMKAVWCVIGIGDWRSLQTVLTQSIDSQTFIWHFRLMNDSQSRAWSACIKREQRSQQHHWSLISKSQDWISDSAGGPRVATMAD